jgi:hypothetical protein
MCVGTQVVSHRSFVWGLNSWFSSQPTGVKEALIGPCAVSARFPRTCNPSRFAAQLCCKRFRRTDSRKAGKPIFCVWNGTRMHFRARVRGDRRHPEGIAAWPDAGFVQPRHGVEAHRGSAGNRKLTIGAGGRRAKSRPPPHRGCQSPANAYRASRHSLSGRAQPPLDTR